jgi:hypothetical protein
MYDEAAAKVVERCMSYGGEDDGKMGFDECEEGGANQTFRYEESSGVVKPIMVNSMASGNDTTTMGPGTPQNGTSAPSAMDIVEDEKTLHDDEFMDESQLGARDDTTPPSGSTNVSLVFVPRYPNAPNTKAAVAGNSTSSTLQKEDDKDAEEVRPSTAATHTVTETVTVSSGFESTTGDASKTLMNAAAASTTDSGSFASVSESSSSLSSSASASASMSNDWEVEVHQADNSAAPTNTPTSSPNASTSSSSVDASSIASRIASQSSDSTISTASATPAPSGTNASQLKFRADRVW